MAVVMSSISWYKDFGAKGSRGCFMAFFDSLHDFSFRFLVRESEGSRSGFHKENMVRRTLWATLGPTFAAILWSSSFVNESRRSSNVMSAIPLQKYVTAPSWGRDSESFVIAGPTSSQPKIRSDKSCLRCQAPSLKRSVMKTYCAAPDTCNELRGKLKEFIGSYLKAIAWTQSRWGVRRILQQRYHQKGARLSPL